MPSSGTSRVYLPAAILGPSLAIADYLPQVVDELSSEYPELKVGLRPFLLARTSTRQILDLRRF
jgi:hypothetical protein